MSLYVGLISGTSMDGIDAALVSFDGNALQVIDTSTSTYPAQLRAQLLNAIQPDHVLSLHDFGHLHVTVGACFAQATNELLARNKIAKESVSAIGSHGQTLRHSPDSDPPYTIQIGDPATIATNCSIETIADFRSLDVAAGGEGAPLVPPFHEAYLRDTNLDTVVVNIGGISNVTILPADPAAPISGFDTGPGNCLLDEWIFRHRAERFDDDGAWASSGSVSLPLLNHLLSDEYVQRPGTKSTGREYFNLAFLDAILADRDFTSLAPADVQASLVSFTAACIGKGIEDCGVDPARVLVCGGGAKNSQLMARLATLFPQAMVDSTDAVGLDPDMIEALAFAWLAHQRHNLRPVTLTTNDTRRPAQFLGAIYLPPRT